jgi:SAM-dependent methyltransferase
MPFYCPEVHQAAADIIRRNSTNPIDIREAALDGLDLSQVEHVLDLGCGFGFFAEVLARRVSAQARLVGIDAIEGNRQAFLSRVQSAGRIARFVQAEVNAILPFESASFDVVASSYSLYFFAEALPEVARVLRPDGWFLAVTHNRDSFRELFRLVDLPTKGAPLYDLIERFSSENGGVLLEQCFDHVERIPYINTLRFSAERLDDLISYFRFKMPLLCVGAPGGALDEQLRISAHAQFQCGNEIRVEKNDMIFRCRGPRCR